MIWQENFEDDLLQAMTHTFVIRALNLLSSQMYTVQSLDSFRNSIDCLSVRIIQRRNKINSQAFDSKSDCLSSFN